MPRERERIERLLEELEHASEGLAPRQDRDVGLALKHDVGWRAIEDRMLQEAKFFSLPHLLDATRDLDCSILLGPATAPVWNLLKAGCDRLGVEAAS